MPVSMKSLCDDILKRDKQILKRAEFNESNKD